MKDKAIWWICSDLSGGGSWSSEGALISRLKIPYDEKVAQSIYEPAYKQLVKK
ncbi:hypothetical protein V2K56_03775 [Pseudomonas alliivorans]|nr:hypothetical protein [Pseudomonas alliivorans]MEE4730670.1 hypothetical protein [Pseudomonas alliivorans]